MTIHKSWWQSVKTWLDTHLPWRVMERSQAKKIHEQEIVRHDLVNEMHAYGLSSECADRDADHLRKELMKIKRDFHVGSARNSFNVERSANANQSSHGDFGSQNSH